MATTTFNYFAGSDPSQPVLSLNFTVVTVSSSPQSVQRNFA